MCDASCNPTVSPTQAHCRGCCQTFSSVSVFDSHRTGDTNRRVCLFPGSVGLKDFSGVWAPPEYQSVLDRLEVARESRGGSNK